MKTDRFVLFSIFLAIFSSGIGFADPIPAPEPEVRVNPFLLEQKFQDAYRIISDRYINQVQTSMLMMRGFREMRGVPGMENLQYQDLVSKTQRLGTSRDDFQAFRSALKNIRMRTGGNVDREAIVSAMIRGMVSGLNDDYSSYLEPDKNRELQEYLMGETRSFAGIGIQFEFKDGNCKVIAPIPDTPAYKEGIRPGDIIQKVDGVQPTSEDDARERMTGEPGARVEITVKREGVPEALVYRLIRQTIFQPELEKIILPDDIGYVRINSFNEHSAKTLEENLRYLETYGMKKCIIDLRRNAGGLLNAAVEMADIFLPKGSLVVRTEGRASDTRREHRTRRNLPYTRIPLVVLVDEYTASAAEILTGAIRDNRRGKIVGKQTFGKGTVQEVRQLDDNSALKLTVAKYLTPSGESIDQLGIRPDYQVASDPDRVVFPSQFGDPSQIDLQMIAKDLQLKKALEILDYRIPVMPQRTVHGPSQEG